MLPHQHSRFKLYKNKSVLNQSNEKQIILLKHTIPMNAILKKEGKKHRP